MLKKHLYYQPSTNRSNIFLWYYLKSLIYRQSIGKVKICIKNLKNKLRNSSMELGVDPLIVLQDADI
jgi:hypothetical protein